MEITQVRVYVRNEEKLKAFVGFTLDNAFAVHNAKIVQGKEKLILCMPSRKTPDGKYVDIAHPINVGMRKQLEATIFEAYKQEVNKIGELAKAV